MRLFYWLTLWTSVFAQQQSLRGCGPVGSNGWFYIDCRNKTQIAEQTGLITDDA